MGWGGIELDGGREEGKRHIGIELNCNLIKNGRERERERDAKRLRGKVRAW